MRRDVQTNMTKLIAAFRNYAKAPKKLLNVAEIQTCLTGPQVRGVLNTRAMDCIEFDSRRRAELSVLLSRSE